MNDEFDDDLDRIGREAQSNEASHMDELDIAGIIVLIGFTILIAVAT